MHRLAIFGVLLAACVLAPPAASASSASSASSTSSGNSPLESALALVPADAAGFVAVPSLKRFNDDLIQCLERMDRPGTAMVGRPLDQAKARLGISVAVEDRGALVAFWPVAPAPTEGMPLAPAAVRLLVPTNDPAGFLAGNFTAAPDVAEDAHRGPDGRVWHARAAGSHVLLSTDAEAVRGHDAGAGLAEIFRSRMGEGWMKRLEGCDLVAWGGPLAMRDLAAQGRAAVPPEVAEAPGYDPAAAERWRVAFEQSLEDGVVAVDVDPLGVALRTFATMRSDSPLGEMSAGARAGRAALDRLPRQPFYIAGAIDLDAVGGAEPLRRFAALAGLSEGAWLEVARNVIAAQFAAYPSKLGLAAGGFLNDSSLAVETRDRGELRREVEQGVRGASGESGGLRIVGKFEADRVLKSGEKVDAFEVTQTPLPAGSGDGGAIDLAQRQLAWQVAFGSRGMHGFLEDAAGSWSVITFSQRPDVLARAVASAAGGDGTLEQDGSIRAMRSWLPSDPQLVGFVGVGQFGRLLKQLAGMIPGGDGGLVPEIPTNLEPIGFGLAVSPGRVETALVIPAGVLGLGYDRIVEQALRGGPTAAGASDPPGGQAP